jgi:predicted nucleotidyltransferase
MADRGRIGDVPGRLGAALSAGKPAGLVSAYRFGSHAAGRAHRESDVDVGVLLAWQAYPSSRERFEARLALAERLGTDRVDVVVLNDATAPGARYRHAGAAALLRGPRGGPRVRP